MVSMVVTLGMYTEPQRKKEKKPCEIRESIKVSYAVKGDKAPKKVKCTQ